MEHKVELGYVVNSVKFNNDNSKPISNATDGTDHSNWGFVYAVHSADEATGGPSEAAGTSKDDYTIGTIFLDSGVDEIYGTSILNNIVINSIPPKFIKDLSVHTAICEPFYISCTFESEVPLDVAQMEISFKYNNIDVNLVNAKRKSSVYTVNGAVSDLKLYSDIDEYTLSFYLDVTKFPAEINDIVSGMNTNGIDITVWDISGNKTKINLKEWIYVGDNTEIKELEHLVIEFFDWEPSNRILKPTVEGRTWVKVYNPNEKWRVPELLVIQNKEGNAFGKVPPKDMWDWSNYCENEDGTGTNNGVVIFQITDNINKPGTIELETWIDIGNSSSGKVSPKVGLVKSSTYADASLDWKFMDPDGRKIKLKPYVPSYLNEENMYEFVATTEDFLNTMYTSLYNDDKNIGILEKAARVGYFNVADQIEDAYLQQYGESFGSELTPTREDAEVFLRDKKINGNYASVEYNATDYNNFMRYIYNELPVYNQYKGSYTGIKMALNMMSLCCKLVELWSRIDDSDEDDFIRADEINDDPLKLTNNDKAQIAKYYLTSRFDVDIQDNDATFEEYNTLADNIIHVIFQVKPITRTLRKLAKIWYAYYNFKVSYFMFGQSNLQQIHHYRYVYNLCSQQTWNKATNKTRHGITYTPAKTYEVTSIFVPYKAECAHCAYLNDDDEYVTHPTSKNSYVVLKNLEKNFFPMFNKSSITTDNLNFNFTLSGDYKKLTTTSLGTYVSNTTPITITPKTFSKQYYTEIDKDNDNNSADDITAIAKRAARYNYVDIVNTENGYYIKFIGTSSIDDFKGYLVSNNLWFIDKQFTTMNLDLTGDGDFQLVDAIQTEENGNIVYYYDVNLKLTVTYDVALGTNYITQNLPTNAWTETNTTTTEEGETVTTHTVTNALTEVSAPVKVIIGDDIFTS